MGVGAGTWLVNTAAGTNNVIAAGSAQGRAAFKGDVGLFVTAGHYGQFFGAEAIRELAYEDRLERRLIPQLLPRL